MDKDPAAAAAAAAAAAVASPTAASCRCALQMSQRITLPSLWKRGTRARHPEPRAAVSTPTQLNNEHRQLSLFRGPLCALPTP